MQDFSSEARLRVAALLQRMLHEAADSFAHADAKALWREVTGVRPPRFGELAAGRWRLRRYRRWLHWVVEVEDALARKRGPALVRYTLFGAPVDMLRLRGRIVDLPLWRGMSFNLVLGAFRPWKRVAA